MLKWSFIHSSDASSARWCKQVSNKICVGGSVDLKVTMMLTMSMTMMMMMTALIMIVAFHLVMMVPPVSSFLSSPFPPSRPPAGSQNSEEPQMVFILKHSKHFFRADHWTNAVYIFPLTLHLCGLKIWIRLLKEAFSSFVTSCKNSCALSPCLCLLTLGYFFAIVFQCSCRGLLLKAPHGRPEDRGRTGFCSN